tara:strand:- start:474 stop:596 length:123 start_codon:yes stop_codon:yes gene_type:complete
MEKELNKMLQKAEIYTNGILGTQRAIQREEEKTQQIRGRT